MVLFCYLRGNSFPPTYTIADSTVGVDLGTGLAISKCFVIRPLTVLELRGQKLELRLLDIAQSKGNMMRIGDDNEAHAIAKNHAWIVHLCLFGNKMINLGLLAVLDGCTDLESLDIQKCLGINLGIDLHKRSCQQLKSLRIPNDTPLEDHYDEDLNDTDSRDGYPKSISWKGDVELPLPLPTGFGGQQCSIVFGDLAEKTLQLHPAEVKKFNSQVLSDREKRAIYDEYGEEGLKGQVPSPGRCIYDRLTIRNADTPNGTANLMDPTPTPEKRQKSHQKMTIRTDARNMVKTTQLC
ncbi:OLC1v1031717C1 [Oldenlandia corymbosa var. corymbosa]|uniref:OLC1v1031717C1 n=1 Tax=Oldenlandia corymbosa var. corymbosa TaxID=529605 RepID=A0AAV1CJZ5_OLDCO|nr:OLC1v1031717C1 [Oldenlandia corymbosa var. corymbosa]